MIGDPSREIGAGTRGLGDVSRGRRFIQDGMRLGLIGTVMRHFSLTLVIIILAAAMQLRPVVRALVLPPCTPQALPTRLLAAPVETVPVAMIASRADDYLLPAPGAVVESAAVSNVFHREPTKRLDSEREIGDAIRGRRSPRRSLGDRGAIPIPHHHVECVQYRRDVCGSAVSTVTARAD